MSEIVCYMPTYSPDEEANFTMPRSYTRASQEDIIARFKGGTGKYKPMMYMDAIDSIQNIRPDIKLVVADGKSTDSIRDALKDHHEAIFREYGENGGDYKLELYPEKMSQWIIFNDIIAKYCTLETKYFIYSSSDIIWHMDWVREAVKEFEKNPKLQILFPFVNKGDVNLPHQVSPSVKDADPFLPPFHDVSRASLCNAYAMIFRMDFLKIYGGYPTAYRNCFTESFLGYMCEAMGGEVRMLPRGHVYHYGEGDKWVTPGSAYYYTEEKFIFQNMMNELLMYKAMGKMDIPYLKKKLYR